MTPEPEVKPEVKPELEVPSERAEPSACPQETSETEENSGEKLAQNFEKRCKFDPESRLRFYMDCGRLHTTAAHFHRPRNPAKPLTYSQLEELAVWFKYLPTTGCYVMNFAMANWPQLRAHYLKSHSSRLGTTPTISGLQKIGSDGVEGEKYLYDLWRKSQQAASLARVAENMPAEPDHYSWVQS